MIESIDFIMGTIKGYFQSAHSIANSIINILLLFELIFIGIKIMLGEIHSLSAIVKKILYIGAWLYIAKNIDTLSDAFMRTLVSMSSRISTTSVSQINFLDNPFTIIQFAYDSIIVFLLEKIDSIAKIREMIKSVKLIVIVFLLVVLLLGIAVSFGLITLIVLFVQIEFYVIVLCAILLLPFMINEHTRFISEKIIPSITSQGIKLMILAIIVQVVLEGYTHVFDTFLKSEQIGFQDMLYIGTIIAIGVYLVFQSQVYAQSIMSGISQSNVAGQAMSAIAGGFTAYKVLSSAKQVSSRVDTSPDSKITSDTVQAHLKSRESDSSNDTNNKRKSSDSTGVGTGTGTI